MPKIHRIRLRGPWQAQVCAAADTPAADSAAAAQQWLRATVPHRWIQPPFDTAAAVRYQRRFNKPTGLTDGETVWLVVEDFGPAISLQLNGSSWPPCSADAAPLRVEITSQLKASNVLTLTVSRGDEPPQPRLGFVGEVALEIG